MVEIQRLTKNVTTPLAYFIILFVVGLTFGNIILLFISLTPLFFLILAIIFDPPHNIHIEREVSKKSAKIDEVIEVKLRIYVNDGLGLIKIKDIVPDELSVRYNLNETVFFKNFGTTAIEVKYQMRCDEIGRYKIGDTNWESNHLFGLKQSLNSEEKNSIYITIKKPFKERDGLDELHLGDIPTPRSSTTNIGIKTTDFKEIKNYTYGDPLKYINWKATARRGQKQKPLVNEYELEGKKCVWIFLDASSGVISSKDSGKVLSKCIEAADTFSRFFTKKGYLIGMYTYNSSKEVNQLVYPERGKKHYRDLSRKLSEISPSLSRAREGLEEAVEECDDFIHRYDPLPIIITTISSADTRALKKGIKKLKSILGGKRKTKAPIFLLDVKNEEYNLDIDDNLIKNLNVMDELERLSISKYVKGMGVNLIEWDPKEEKVSKAVMREVSRYKN